MRSTPASHETLEHSLRLIAVLEQRRRDLPFAERVIARHQETHRGLEQTIDASEAAVELWREALARRWECEVAGRRLYKQVLRSLAEMVGESSPHVQLISRGGAEANSSPSELLDDLRRLRAALVLDELYVPALVARIPQIDAACAELEGAIAQASAAERQRRASVIESRMARESFRRVCEETLGALAAHYGDHFESEFSFLRESLAA